MPIDADEIKKKTQEIKALNVDLELQDKIIQIFFSNSERFSSESEILEEEIRQIQDFSSSNSSSQSSDGKNLCSCKSDSYEAILGLNGLSLNVLTAEQNLILDVIDKIIDPNEKRNALEKYIELAQQNKELKKLSTASLEFMNSYNEIIERDCNSITRGPTVHELRQDVNILKK